MLNCIVLDDDEVFLALMKLLVEEHPDLKLLGCYESVDDAREMLDSNGVDLILLDIEMPGTNGIELLKSSRRLPQVIFVSAHSKYALEAFEYDVTDYLLKPITEDRFTRSIAKAKVVHDYQKFNSKQSHIYFKVDNKTIKVRFEDIAIIESYGDYIKLYERDNRHVILGTLNRMQETLDDEIFMRIHRRYIVRIGAIMEIKGHVAIVDQSRQAQISRAKKPELVKRLA